MSTTRPGTELNAIEELYDIAALLSDPERYVVESVWSRASHAQAVAVATSRCTGYGKLRELDTRYGRPHHRRLFRHFFPNA